MKQLIIFLLIVILVLIGYGKYNQYKRYNSPEVNYITDQVLYLENHNPEIVKNYYDAVENLNSFVMMQWTANSIDVRTPKNDDAETKLAIETYAKKLAYIKFLELKLSKKESAEINLNNNSKKEIDKIKGLFDPCLKLYNGQKNPLTFEIQKRLVKLGYKIKIDGVYRFETLNAIKNFEEKNNLLADGYLDLLTIETMFE